MFKSLLFVAFAVLGLAIAGIAQDVTLSTPVARSSEAKYKIRTIVLANPPGAVGTATVEVSVQDAGNVEIRILTLNIPDVTHSGATLAGLNSAMVNVRATETGSDARKMQFRVLGYFSDQGYFPAATVNP